MNNERNILVIYLSSPASVGKSALMLTLKYLRREGWRPTVITLPREGYTREPVAEWFGIDIIVPGQFKSRLWKFSRSLFRARAWCKRRSHIRSKNTYLSIPGMLAALTNYLLLPATLALSFPDRYRHSIHGVQEVAKNLHRERSFEAVLSMYDPMSSHLVARQFSGNQGLPWIALTKDYYSKPSNLVASKLGVAKNWLKSYYEKSVLRKSVSVMAVYDDLAQHLKELMPGKEVNVLTHCYDDEDFENLENPQGHSDGVFRILWLGTVQGFDRESLQTFFASLQEMLQEGNIDPLSFRARFVGPGVELVRSFAAGYGCEELLELVPSIPHEEAMTELKLATCLLFTQVHIGGRRRLPEFIATRKPILVYPPEHGSTMSDRVLRTYGAAVIVEADRKEIKATLTRWYEQYRTKGTLELTANEEIVRSFSASRVAGRLNQALEAATAPVSAETPRVPVTSTR